VEDLIGVFGIFKKDFLGAFPELFHFVDSFTFSFKVRALDFTNKQ
jgi:hypothetical protein